MPSVSVLGEAEYVTEGPTTCLMHYAEYYRKTEEL